MTDAQKRNNWRITDPAKRVDLRKILHAQNPALVAEAMRQECDRQRLRRLFGAA
ncbi:hypothetical protein PBI_OKIROE_85 [Mycobacterium phage OkiRoe]|uniref:hypothetical protein n=1 Tax=Mycobacterium phage OkiRoe TaxID=1486473 RepID=UPI00045F720A|nr:hypothetical protein PBI_OKIROE_85 [Mycobacterium phage OkiRoe]AHZ95646.1 hypothetical protein PBI_OKIROE_85 [Mycobacterium phage OkiRoe]